MNKLVPIIIAGLVIFIIAQFISSCATTAAVAEKSGTQLWGENCLRCHNTMPSSAYSNRELEVIDMHMRIRANLTDQEAKKILEFLQSSN